MEQDREIEQKQQREEEDANTKTEDTNETERGQIKERRKYNKINKAWERLEEVVYEMGEENEKRGQTWMRKIG